MIDKKTLPRKSALGKGLKALLSDASLLVQHDTFSTAQEVAIVQIQENPFQPRTDFDASALQDLCDSIVSYGIIQPITVRTLSPSTYQLIAGERRLKAAKMAGLSHIPAYIRTADDQQMLEIALVENIQRENLNPIEIALSYQRLLQECRIKQEVLGARLGKDRTTVNNYLRLLKLPLEIQLALRTQKIGMGHARALISLKNVHAQLDIFKKILEKALSVRDVEVLVRKTYQDSTQVVSSKQKRVPVPEDVLQEARMKLSKRLGTAVAISAYTGERAEIKLTFSNRTLMDRMLKLLSED